LYPSYIVHRSSAIFDTKTNESITSGKIGYMDKPY
jgi:hypothetical protein